MLPCCFFLFRLVLGSFHHPQSGRAAIDVGQATDVRLAWGVSFLTSARAAGLHRAPVGHQRGFRLQGASEVLGPRGIRGGESAVLSLLVLVRRVQARTTFRIICLCLARGTRQIRKALLRSFAYRELGTFCFLFFSHMPLCTFSHGGGHRFRSICLPSSRDRSFVLDPGFGFKMYLGPGRVQASPSALSSCLRQHACKVPSHRGTQLFREIARGARLNPDLPSLFRPFLIPPSRNQIGRKT